MNSLNMAKKQRTPNSFLESRALEFNYIGVEIVSLTFAVNEKKNTKKLRTLFV